MSSPTPASTTTNSHPPPNYSNYMSSEFASSGFHSPSRQRTLSSSSHSYFHHRRRTTSSSSSSQAYCSSSPSRPPLRPEPETETFHYRPEHKTRWLAPEDLLIRLPMELVELVERCQEAAAAADCAWERVEELELEMEGWMVNVVADSNLNGAAVVDGNADADACAVERDSGYGSKFGSDSGSKHGDDELYDGPYGIKQTRAQAQEIGCHNLRQRYDHEMDFMTTRALASVKQAAVRVDKVWDCLLQREKADEGAMMLDGAKREFVSWWAELKANLEASWGGKGGGA